MPPVLLEPLGDPRHHGPPQPHQALSRFQGVLFLGDDDDVDGDEYGGGGIDDDDGGQHGYSQPINRIYRTLFQGLLNFWSRILLIIQISN